MAKIKILDASPGDESKIILLLKETWLVTYPNKKYNIIKEDILKKDWSSKERLEKWQKTIAENGKNGVFNFVAKEGNKIVGFCQVVKGKDYNDLKIIYVLPEYQGKEIGKMLANKAMSLLDFSKDTIVEVVKYNKGAIGFYEKLGFAEFEKGKGHEVSNGKTMPTIRMKLKSENIKNFLDEIVKIKIDRPIGSKHPKHGFVHEVNYGFVPDTKAPDGEEIDAYLLGTDKPAKEFIGKCIAIIHRLDDNDDKLVIVPENFREISDEEILKAVNFQEKWFKSVVIRKSKKKTGK